jgi:uncharacterized protein involved in outer membrane biogenesis
MARLLRTLLHVIFGILMIAALAVGVAVLVLQSPRGSTWVRGQIVSQINARIGGTVKVGGLRWRPLNEIVVHDLVLADPSGGRVVSLDRAFAKLDLLALFHRELHVTRLDLGAPHVSLCDVDGTLNLSRALATSSPEANPAGSSSSNGSSSSGLDVPGGLAPRLLGSVQLHDRLRGHHELVAASHEIELQGGAIWRASRLAHAWTDLSAHLQAPRCEAPRRRPATARPARR